MVSTCSLRTTSVLTSVKISSRLLGVQSRAVGEVEAQAVGPDERPLLAHVVAEDACAVPRAAGGSPCGCAASPRGAPASMVATADLAGQDLAT